MITPLQVVTGSGVFCFAYLQEVTAHGEAKPKTLPASRMPGTDSGRMVPQASACPPTEPERGQRGLSQLVFQGRLDPGTAPGTTAAGTFLPGLCGQMTSGPAASAHRATSAITFPDVSGPVETVPAPHGTEPSTPASPQSTFAPGSPANYENMQPPLQTGERHE